MLNKKAIEDALKKHWNIGPAAKELGVGYSTLRKYIKHYDIAHNSRLKKDGATFDRNVHIAKKITQFRRQRKLDSLEYRGGMKCSRCGFNEPIPDCYAFHHRDPSKKDPNWAKMKTNNSSWEVVKAELDKCDVLCHNCHSIVHYLNNEASKFANNHT
jgi:hypothetical protein